MFRVMHESVDHLLENIQKKVQSQEIFDSYEYVYLSTIDLCLNTCKIQLIYFWK